MKQYFCVTSSVDNKGHVTAAITMTLYADKAPRSTSTSTRRKDIYNDWFNSLEEAQQFVKQAALA